VSLCLAGKGGKGVGTRARGGVGPNEQAFGGASIKGEKKEKRIKAPALREGRRKGGERKGGREEEEKRNRRENPPKAAKGQNSW